MASGAGFVSTEEAAHTLGVTVQHVRRLAESNDLTRVARGLMDRTSVERYASQRQGGRTRVWAEHTAWGAIALLSGMRADWLGAAQASRVRTTLGDLTDAAEFVTRTRDRASVRIYAGHSSVLGQTHDLVSTDQSALGLVRSATDRVDGYLAVGELDSTVERLGLIEDSGGNITLRATGFDLDIVRGLASKGAVLAALDAATSLDPRERGVGERALAEALARYST
ncbi:MAG: hypothetical protein JWN96_334 [Mycobacterium sp.]|nr:hypothetical protein [Mycobacterium sp.]